MVLYKTLACWALTIWNIVIFGPYFKIINTRIPPFVMEHPVVTCCKWVSLYCHIQNYINVTNVRGHVRDTTRCTSELKSEKKCYSGKPQRLKSTFFWKKIQTEQLWQSLRKWGKNFKKTLILTNRATTCTHILISQYFHF